MTNRRIRCAGVLACFFDTKQLCVSSGCVAEAFCASTFPNMCHVNNFLLTAVGATVLLHLSQIKISLPANQSPYSSATTNWRGLSRNMNSSMIEVLFKVCFSFHCYLIYFFSTQSIFLSGSRSGGLWRGDISHRKRSCPWMQFH